MTKSVATCVAEAVALGLKDWPRHAVAREEETAWKATAYMKELGELAQARPELREQCRFLSMDFAAVAMDAVDRSHPGYRLGEDIRPRIGRFQAWYA